MKGSVLQSAVIDALIWDGWLVIRPNSGAMKTGDETETGNGRYITFIRWSALGFGENITKGVSDVLAFRPGLMLALEIKGDGDKLTAEQVDFLQAWEQAGGVGLEVRAVEDLRPYLVRLEV